MVHKRLFIGAQQEAVNKNVLRRRLNVCVERNCLSSGGSLFHARGAATQNAPSPNFRLVRGTMKSPRLAIRRPGRPDTSAADVSRSLMYAGECPASVLWTSRHSLNSVLCLIGIQCKSRRAGDTWSRGRRSMTTRAAACSTRRNGANVDAGSPVNTALQ